MVRTLAQSLDIQILSPKYTVDRLATAEWHVANDGSLSHWILVCFRSGIAHYRINGRKYQISAGNVLFLRPGDVYTGTTDTESLCSFISCGFLLEANDPDSAAILSNLPSIFRCSRSSHMEQCFSELIRIRALPQTGSLIKFRSLILDILWLLMDDEKRRSMHSTHYQTIADIIETMRCHYERTYSLTELCEMASLSSSHFRTLFKQMTGCTAKQYQIQLKIEKAKDLIVSHTCNVAQAADAVGFTDPYYFSRVFRQLTGKSPSEYL